MKNEYLAHNLFWRDAQSFSELDPHLSQLVDLKFVHPLDWWREINWETPGIYILTGGRQIGKSTSTKLLIKHLLGEKRFAPQSMFYLPCDQIDDHHALSREIRSFLEQTDSEDFLLVLDEISFVREWDRAIKALADEGIFRKGFCVLTGSDSVILKEASSRFPGRRGQAEKVDFEIFPLSYGEYLKLTDGKLLDEAESRTEELFDALDRYLICGGYLKAINEFHSNGKLGLATQQTFEQWIRGDFEKRGKNSRHLEEILAALYETSTSQVTFSRLAQRTSGISTDTVISYCQMLQRMNIIVILEAFDQNSLRGFPKKARKIHFMDPFISGVIGSCLQRERYIHSKQDSAAMVESVVAANLGRRFPVYYIKAAGEVDIVALKGREFIPIEVKWTSQIRTRDLKQIKKYPNSILLARQMELGDIDGIPSIPLPIFLISPDVYITGKFRR